MTTNSTLQERNSTLAQIAQADNRGFITSETTFAMIDLCTFGLIQRVTYEGPCMEDQRYDSLSNHDVYEITELGAKYLSAHMPMVDQPQPIDETTIVGEVSFYADGKTQDGTIVAGTDRYGYTVRSVNGKVYDEIKRGDIEPRLGDELDDLPFSDVSEPDEPTPVLFDGLHVNELSNSKLAMHYQIVATSEDKSNLWILQAEMKRRSLGEPDESTSFEQFVLNGGQGEWSMDDEDTKEPPKTNLAAAMLLGAIQKFGDFMPDDEDTKELPAITVEPEYADRTGWMNAGEELPGLIDAALNPDDTEAYATLKSYDWASVPLWVIEIERDDVNAYKWEIWHELRKMNGGILLSNPDAVYKGREVDRAFNVMAILNDAIYSFHKGMGFNVEN